MTRVYLADRSTSEGPAWKSITVAKSPDGEDAVFFNADGDGDLDVSEENDNARDGKAALGVVWYENPTPITR